MLPLLLAAVTLAAEPEDRRIAADLKALQGTWEIDRIESGGKVQSQRTKDQPIGQIVIEGDQITLGKMPAVPMTLYPRTNPKGLDISRGKNRQPFECIYKVDGDELWICMIVNTIKGETGVGRPKNFRTAVLDPDRNDLEAFHALIVAVKK